LYDPDFGRTTPGAEVYEGFGTYVFEGAQGTWYPIIYNSDSAPVLEAGKYWIVLFTQGGAGIARNFADGTGNWYGNADSSGDGVSDPFGPGTAGNGTISAYIAYQCSAPRRQLGRDRGRVCGPSDPDHTRKHTSARQRDDVGLRELLDAGAVMDGGGSCRSTAASLGEAKGLRNLVEREGLEPGTGVRGISKLRK
jgi:hypothetical protein